MWYSFSCRQGLHEQKTNAGQLHMFIHLDMLLSIHIIQDGMNYYSMLLFHAFNKYFTEKKPIFIWRIISIVGSMHTEYLLGAAKWHDAINTKRRTMEANVFFFFGEVSQNFFLGDRLL